MIEKIKPMKLTDFINDVIAGNKPTIEILVGALLGGLVRIANDKGQSLRKSLVIVLSGVVSAYFLAPTIAGWVGVAAPLIGYLTGMVGMELVRVIIDAAAFFRENPGKALEFLSKFSLSGIFKYFRKGK